MIKLQQEDMLALGQLTLVLACKSVSAVQNIPKSVEFVGTQYSQELKNFIVLLFSKPSTPIDDIFSMISGRLVSEVDQLRKFG